MRLDQPQSATVTVEIVPVAVERRLEGVGVVARGLADGRTARVEPATVVVILRGARTRLAPLTTVAGFVDVTGVGPGLVTLPVKIDPIAGVELTGVEPATVAVRIR